MGHVELGEDVVEFLVGWVEEVEEVAVGEKIVLGVCRSETREGQRVVDRVPATGGLSTRAC